MSALEPTDLYGWYDRT